ncbi:MAG: hypothetical protein QOI96_2175, partial [Verrucomicrobiota bacterium]
VEPFLAVVDEVFEENAASRTA